MRILLNLLPEEQKEELIQKFRFRFFLWQSMLILILQGYYALTLVGMYSMLDYQVRIARDSLTEFDQFNHEAKQLLAYQDEFKMANKMVATVNQYEKGHLQWGALFSLLRRRVPEGVTLIELSTKDYIVSLVGQSDTRDTFLKFEDSLKNDECVSDVKVPLSSLFSQTEVDFQIDFTLKRDCLLNFPG